MNFAFVACTVALWGLEYLLGLEDITQRGQRGVTCARWGTYQGGQLAPATPTDQAAPKYSNRLLSIYFGTKNPKKWKPIGQVG